MKGMKYLSKIREYIPLKAIIFFVVTLLSGIILLIERYSVGFADFINTVSAPFRAVIAWLTAWIPFSLAEILLIAIPVWLVILIAIGIKKAKAGLKPTVRYICFILCIPCFIFFTFVWTYSSGYHNTTLDKKLGFDEIKVEKDELY